MTILSKTLIAAGFALAMTSECGLAFAGSVPDTMQTHRTARHYKADFGKASALAPAARLQPAPAKISPDTDGLSRDIEDCNYGCVDNTP